MSGCPEHARLSAVVERSQSIGEFFEIDQRKLEEEKRTMLTHPRRIDP